MATQNSETFVHNKGTNPRHMFGTLIPGNGFARVAASAEDVKKHKFGKQGIVYPAKESDAPEAESEGSANPKTKGSKE